MKQEEDIEPLLTIESTLLRTVHWLGKVNSHQNRSPAYLTLVPTFKPSREQVPYRKMPARAFCLRNFDVARAYRGASPAVEGMEDSEGFIAEEEIVAPRFPARSGIVGGQEDLVDIQDGIVGYAEGLAAGADIPGVRTQALAVDREAIGLSRRAAQGERRREDFQRGGQDFRIQPCPLGRQEQAEVVATDLGIREWTQVRCPVVAAVQVRKGRGQPLAQGLAVCRRPKATDQLLSLQTGPKADRFDHSCRHKLAQAG